MLSQVHSHAIINFRPCGRTRSRMCETCYCYTNSSNLNVRFCTSCVRCPRSPLFSALDVTDDDGSTCSACRALLCPLHLTAIQRARGVCLACSGEAHEKPESDSNDAVSMDVEDDYAEDDSDFEPVTTPLSYRHAYGIEYEDVDSSSYDDDDRIEELDSTVTLGQWLATYNQHDMLAARQDDADLCAHYPYTLVPTQQSGDCSICLDVLSDVSAVMHCHSTHIFHQPCIDTWLHTSLQAAAVVKCPLCQHAF